MTTSMAISGQKDSRGQRRDQLTCMKVIRLFMPRQSSENAARLPGLSFILYSSLMSPVNNTKHTVLTCTAHLCPLSTKQSTQSSPVQLTYVPYSSLMSPVNNTKHTVFTSTAHLCPQSTTQSTQSSPVQLTYVPSQQHKAHSPHLYSSLMSPVNKTKDTVLTSTAHLCLLSTTQSTQSSPVQLTYVPYSSLMSPVNNTKHTVFTSTAHLCPQSTTQSTQSSPVQLTYVPSQQHKAHSPHLYSSLMSPVNKTKDTVLTSTAHLCLLSTTQSTQSSPVQLTYVPYSSLMSPVNNTKHTVFTSTAHLCPLQLTYVSCQQHKTHSLHQYSSLMSPTAHLCLLSTAQSTQSSPVQLTYVPYSSLMSPVNNTKHTVFTSTAHMSPNTKHTVLTSTAHLCPLSTTQSTQSSFIQLACHLTTTQCRHKYQQIQNRHVTSTKRTSQQFSSQCGS